MTLGSLFTKALYSLGYWRQGPAKLTDPVLGQWLGATSNYAGKSVTVDAALQISVVRACVTLLAETIATLPCNVYEAGPDGRRLARSHPLYVLLHDAPNADMTAVEYWELVASGLLLWGNSFSVVDRVLGRVVSLTPLSPSLVTVRRDANGSPFYTYADPDGGRPREYAEDEILHIRGFSLDGVTGVSPIAQMAHSIGLAMAAEETAGKLFSNGMRTGGYVAAPQVLNAPQRAMAEELLGRFQGSSNAGRVPILEAGWRFERFSMAPQEAELLATRAFSVEDLCRAFRVPPHMVGHHEKSTSWGSGLEQQLIGFQTMTLRPWLKRIEAACKRRLLAPSERGRIEIEFNVGGLLRGDSSARAAYYTAMVTNGIYTRDECRDLENMPRRGGGADLLTIQSQNVPIDLAGATLAPPATAAPAPATAQRETP